jgi:UDP-perosamine 4-acetyltransferase
VVVSGAVVGRQALINTGAVVEHDCRIEEGASLGPGAVTGGRVTVGRGAFIGAGATLAPRITIGAEAMIGAGAVVTRDVGPGMLAYGVPAREMRPVQPDRDWARVL